MPNEFSRTELLIGKEALHKLALSKVAIFGIGGVGSFAAEALARCGIGQLVLVDHDLICATNINRQIHATHSTVGQPKVEVMKNRILDINPRARVETSMAFYPAECEEQMPSADLDYIIDAIDTVSSKIELVVNAKRLNIPIISSMGAGNKLDPGRFEIADIYQTSVCPLAKVMRRELRKRDIPALKVVYSKEPPQAPILSGESACQDGCICPPGSSRSCLIRRQVPGSISFVPSAAGLLLAGHVVRELIK